jgi:hypothetical protein
MADPASPAARWTTVALGASLFAAPFFLGFGGQPSLARNLWVVGALTAALALLAMPWAIGASRAYLALVVSAECLVVVAAAPFVPPPFAVAVAAAPAATVVLWLLERRVLRSPALLARGLSPEAIVGYGGPAEEPAGPARLYAQVVERLEQIERTLQAGPSETEVEACCLGYRICAADMAFADAVAGEAFQKAGLLGRLRLRLVSRPAKAALARVREAFPAEALARSLQEQG